MAQDNKVKYAPQPERKPRYCVEFEDNDGDVAVIIEGVLSNVELNFCTNHKDVKYKEGIDYETAEKAQALYGGEIKEIK